MSPWILKPDILAPRVDILAAGVPNRGVALIGDEYLLSNFELLSGTSMASPHAVGVAVLLKTLHKDWSPAAFRSAMMTTVHVIDNTKGSIIDMTIGVAGTPLDYGAGHINPEKAMDLGLVYDIGVQDYINYLCGMNYTSKLIKIITKRLNFSCDKAGLDLNYLSFIVILNDTNNMSYTFNQVLTNVVDSPSTYCAVLKAPSGMEVVVQPPVVCFAGKYSKAEFNITIEVSVGDASPQSDSIVNYGYLIWNDVNGTHMVRSPIVVAYAP
ncbi:subtilisin-like protease SBT3 [Cornus florida]|uniref:subtilisin-like protease SBT3 n=1 Tax=Cornus florida TaxID=4283 RepID=UPI0028A0B646|nr:subtilisin-like protease SBT3 [Cornus florida]